MTDSSADRDPLDRLAEEFVARFRNGERPSLTEYVERLPSRANEIWDLFPALVEMEQLKPVSADQTGPFVPPASQLDPERIGEFRIIRRVGAGGMGVVYEAIQDSLGRHVALKVLPAEALSDPRRLERFRREARAAAKLHHTNIVPVFGTGEADGRHFYSMQFIAGHPLDAVIDEVRRLKGDSTARPDRAISEVAFGLMTGDFVAPAPPRQSTEAAGRDVSGTARASDSSPTVSEHLSDSGRHYWLTVARVASQAADALAYAHAQGVFHRDIKPANLLLDLQGVLWVADFGLAKSEDADDLTHAGDVVGTLRYMAPERFEGVGDHRADVYALGVTMYELLTLTPAFRAKNRAQLMEQVIAAEPVKPRAVNPAIPRDLETIVLKAIARDPAMRYQNAAEMGDDLRRYLEDLPIRARRATVREKAWRWCRRNPMVASLIASVAVLLLTGAIGGVAAAARFKDQADVAIRAKRDADGARREVGVQLWHSQLNEARANTRTGMPGQRFGSLALLKTALASAREAKLADDDLKQFRDVAAAALALPDLEVIKEWEGYPTGSYHLAVDATFQRYARASNDGAVSVRRMEDDEELFTFPATGRPATIALSDSGNLLVVCDFGGAATEKNGRVYRLNEPKPVLIHEAPMGHGRNVFISPDDRHVYFVSPSGLMAWDRETDRTGCWPLPGGQYGFCARSRDGSKIAVLVQNSRGGVLHVQETASGGTAVDLPLPQALQSIDSCAWHPSGRIVAVAQGVKIHLLDVETKREIGILGHSNHGVMMDFNPTGDRLFSTDWSGVLRLWDWRAGKHLLNMPSSFCMHTRWISDDGRLIAHGSDARKLTLIRLTPGLEQQQFTPSGVVANNFKIDPAGRLAVTTRSDEQGLNGLQVFDVGSRSPVSQLPARHMGVLHISGDGALLTFGTNAIVRWPRVQVASGVIRFGPPQPLFAFQSRDIHSASKDGEVIVIPNHQAGAIVYHSGQASIAVNLGPQENVAYTAVSPNGRFAATGNHAGTAEIGAKVWDTHSGKEVAALRVYGGPLWFSPDGRLLATGGKGGVRLWRTDTWTAGPTLADADRVETCSFSPDGRTLAVSGLGEIRLFRVEDGVELVRMRCFERANYNLQGFSADSGRLYAINEDTGAATVLDLRRLRAGLTEIGLDWDAPTLPPATSETGTTPRVEFVGVDLLSDAKKMAAHQRFEVIRGWLTNPLDSEFYARFGATALDAGRRFVARLLFDVALALNPGRADVRLRRARCALQTGDFDVAAADATAVLERFPTQTTALRVHADACRRLGRHAEADADLAVLYRNFDDNLQGMLQRVDAFRAAKAPGMAAAELRRAEQLLDKASPTEINNLAWYLVTGPVAYRKPERALELIAKAAAAQPNNVIFLNTLGVAQYRNGMFKEAVATLSKSLAAEKGAHDGFDLFFLAMCHQKLGDVARAKDCYDQAVKWMHSTGTVTLVEKEELDEFRREAAAALGMN